MSSLSDWHTRPKRTRHPPPISYWQEYVETDTWYLNKLVEDVPPEEMHAALYDENLEEDAGEEDEAGVEDSSEDEQSVDNDYTCDEVSDATDELVAAREKLNLIHEALWARCASARPTTEVGKATG